MGSQNEITSSHNITNLTQHQLIVLFSSFLLLSSRLLVLSFKSSSAAVPCMTKEFKHKVPGLSVIFYSPKPLPPRPSPPHPTHSVSYVFSPRVLCCWWATEKSLIPNTVWARAHTRGEWDSSIHSSASFWSLSQKKNIPMGHSSSMSVCLCVCL